MPADLIHVWNRCHACGNGPISGTRFECKACPIGPDTNLCAACHAGFLAGRVTHPADGRALISDSGEHVFLQYEGWERDRYLPWLDIPFESGDTPAVEDGFVVRLEFRCGYDSFIGTHGFIIDPGSGSRPIVLTALHVMDRLLRAKGIGGLQGNARYTGEEAARCITSVILYDAFVKTWALAKIGTATAMLVLAHARLGETEPCCLGDIAAFQVDEPHPPYAAKLAASRPRAGESVWLAARSDSNLHHRAHEAVVVEATAGSLTYRYKGRVADLRNTSGAPILNRRAEIVGINIGGGCFEGERFGHANPLDSIRNHLRDSVHCII